MNATDNNIMADESTKDYMETVEHSSPPDSQLSHTPHDGPIQPPHGEEAPVTWKTWVVVHILAWSGGISFWIVPAFASIAATVCTELGNASASAWIVSTYTLTITVAFMICAANSDLFGRRWFIIIGNVLLFVGFIVGGTAKSTTALIVSMALIAFGGGNTQLVAFALPELLPNKWRPQAVVVADTWTFFSVVVGPIASRFAINHGDSWRWLFYGPAIASATSFTGLLLLYFPPKHPRGLPFRQALRELDYGGAILFILGITLTLTGINYTTIVSSSDPKVIGTLVAGFGSLVLFGLFETFMPLKQPLTPTRVFTRSHGRELTAPFIVGFVVTMFYFGINIIYPTQISVFFTKPTDSFKHGILMTLPQNLGLVFGGVMLMVVGGKIKHWRLTLMGAVTTMVVFGALMALGNPQRKNLMMAFVFLAEMGFGWAQYLSIAYIQFGTDQVELGISGGLAGVARFAGGSVAVSVYTAILSNVLASHVKTLVQPAAIGAGLPASSLEALVAALPLGAEALAKVPGITTKIAEVAGAAYVQCYVVALRTVALSSLAFGIIAIIACLCCLDITPKMNNKTEVFLENDVNAEKNVFH